MTLFHLREFWTTNCGNEEEEFDKCSMCICNIDNCPSGYGKKVTESCSIFFAKPEFADKIITASFNGILRVYRIELSQTNKSEQNHFQPSDLLLEVDLKSPIVQIAAGILLASTNIQLAVLHAEKLCVYSISCKHFRLFAKCGNFGFAASSGVTEHGTSYNILLIYEHYLENKAVGMILGPFGRIKGKSRKLISDF